MKFNYIFSPILMWLYLFSGKLHLAWNNLIICEFFNMYVYMICVYCILTEINNSIHLVMFYAVFIDKLAECRKSISSAELIQAILIAAIWLTVRLLKEKRITFNVSKGDGVGMYNFYFHRRPVNTSHGQWDWGHEKERLTRPCIAHLVHNSYWIIYHDRICKILIPLY